MILVPTTVFAKIFFGRHVSGMLALQLSQMRRKPQMRRRDKKKKRGEAGGRTLRPGTTEIPSDLQRRPRPAIAPQQGGQQTGDDDEEHRVGDPRKRAEPGAVLFGPRRQRPIVLEPRPVWDVLLVVAVVGLGAAAQGVLLVEALVSPLGHVRDGLQRHYVEGYSRRGGWTVKSWLVLGEE